MKNAYVTAITQSILAGQSVEEVLVRVRARMTAHGHMRLYSQVLRAAARVLGAKEKRAVPQVTLAKVGGVDESVLAAAIARLGAEGKSYEVTIDETLIGGFTARFKDTLLDASYKRSLVDLYRKITK